MEERRQKGTKRNRSAKCFSHTCSATYVALQSVTRNKKKKPYATVQMQLSTDATVHRRKLVHRRNQQSPQSIDHPQTPIHCNHQSTRPPTTAATCTTQPSFTGSNAHGTTNAKVVQPMYKRSSVGSTPEQWPQPCVPPHTATGRPGYALTPTEQLNRRPLAVDGDLPFDHVNLGP